MIYVQLSVFFPFLFPFFQALSNHPVIYLSISLSCKPAYTFPPISLTADSLLLNYRIQCEYTHALIPPQPTHFTLKQVCAYVYHSSLSEIGVFFPGANKSHKTMLLFNYSQQLREWLKLLATYLVRRKATTANSLNWSWDRRKRSK